MKKDSKLLISIIVVLLLFLVLNILEYLFSNIPGILWIRLQISFDEQLSSSLLSVATFFSKLNYDLGAEVFTPILKLLAIISFITWHIKRQKILMDNFSLKQALADWLIPIVNCFKPYHRIKAIWINKNIPGSKLIAIWWASLICAIIFYRILETEKQSDDKVYNMMEAAVFLAIPALILFTIAAVSLFKIIKTIDQIQES